MKTCVYIVNQHYFYMGMVANSIGMLRRYNSSIPVKLYLIEDDKQKTMIRANQPWFNFTEEELIKICDRLNVEVLRRKPVGDYFHINRSYFQECEENTVFFIDGDTFIFGDVEEIIDKYQDFDFVASHSAWVETNCGFSKKYCKFPPYNSGVMIWNNGWIRKWALQLEEICLFLREKEEWFKDNYCHTEELSVSYFINKNNLNNTYFADDEVFLPKGPPDLSLEKLKKSVILHSYSDHWIDVYKKLKIPYGKTNKFKPKLIRK